MDTTFGYAFLYERILLHFKLLLWTSETL